MSDNSTEQGNVRLTVIALVSLGIAVLVIIIIAVSMLSRHIAGAVVAGLCAVMASVLSIIVSKHWEKRLDIEQEHRRKKSPFMRSFYFRCLLRLYP